MEFKQYTVLFGIWMSLFFLSENKRLLVDGYKLTILHTNDIHAHFEQFSKYWSDCSIEDAKGGKCWGGVARRMTKVKEIRASQPNVVFLDAGDEFLGTLWFNHYRGTAASFFMTKLGYDVMCLGNHEFDTGVDGLVTFLDNVTFPVVSANTDVDVEPRLQGKFKKSHTLTVGGERIGVIGYITQETYLISNGGPTVAFNDEVDAVKKEVTKLQNEGVNKIIALGHAGFAMDKEIAAINGVDIVVGGHTNTFLFNGEQPSNDAIQGPYPTVVDQGPGKRALVVQDFVWGKYLGNLQVTFDNNGDITTYSGNPIPLNSSVQEDPEMRQFVTEWEKPIQELKTEEVGLAAMFLDGSRTSCRLKECLMGNLFTDAIIDFHRKYPHSKTSWAPAAIAIWNGGGLRASIEKGSVSVGDILTVLPFGNEIDLITVTGADLREQLEKSVANWDPVEQDGRFLQVSGLIVIYNISKPVGERVLDVHVRCLECDEKWIKYHQMEDTKEYKLFASSFVIRGGDGYEFKPISHERFNTAESETLLEYFRKYSPVSSKLERRIQFANEPEVSSASSFGLSTLAIQSCLFVLYFLLL